MFFPSFNNEVQKGQNELWRPSKGLGLHFFGLWGLLTYPLIKSIGQNKILRCADMFFPSFNNGVQKRPKKWALEATIGVWPRLFWTLRPSHMSWQPIQMLEKRFKVRWKKFGFFANPRNKGSNSSARLLLIATVVCLCAQLPFHLILE